MPHFMIMLILYINLIKPVLDNKMSIFEEYGAFKPVLDKKMSIFEHWVLAAPRVPSDAQADLKLC